MSILLAALLVTAAAEAPPPAKPAEKVRCKREVETGSLVKVRKECHTEAEWQAVYRQAREDRDRLQGPGRNSDNPGGGG